MTQSPSGSEQSASITWDLPSLPDILDLKGEHWWNFTQIGKTNKSAFSVFENFALKEIRTRQNQLGLDLGGGCSCCCYDKV